MAKKGKEDKIRVHNKSGRDFEYRNEKGEIKKLEHGRAVEIPETKALKMIKDYPRDLINFDDMLSGDRKDLNKENKRLKFSEIARLINRDERTVWTNYLHENENKQDNLEIENETARTISINIISNRFFII